jgi:hypothetical protein
LSSSRLMSDGHTRSLARIASALHWLTMDRKPYKAKVQRAGETSGQFPIESFALHAYCPTDGRDKSLPGQTGWLLLRGLAPNVRSLLND